MKSLIPVIAWKEIIHIRRDPRTLGLIFFLPVFQLIIFGYAVSVDIKNISTAILNYDSGSLSRELIYKFSNSTYFRIKYYIFNRKDGEDLLKKGLVKVVIELPPDFTKKIQRGESTSIGISIDGTDPNPATTVLNTASAITQMYGSEIVIRKTGRKQFQRIEARSRVYFNPELKNSNFMIPGIIGILLQILIPILTTATLVKEKEKGTLEILITTPVKRAEIIIGKIIPYMVIAFIDVIIILTLGSVLFNIKITGNILLLLCLSFLFLCGSLALGLFISSIAQNQYQAFQIILPLFPLSVILSGFIFPREGMPDILYGIGYIVPLTYFLKILRGIILKGIGSVYLFPEIIALFLYTLFFISLSILSFKKRIQ